LLARLAALSDPIRFRIVEELAACDRCACDLQEVVAVAPNLLSYHLKVLRKAGIIEGTRRGRWIDYHLVRGALGEVRTALPEDPTQPPGRGCRT